MDAAGILGVLGLLEDGIHLVEDDHPLAFLLETAAHVLDGVHGGVQVASADEVTNVEGIDLTFTLEVIDLEGELDLCNLWHTVVWFHFHGSYATFGFHNGHTSQIKIKPPVE